ncbi:MAG: DUF1302 family protein [Roseovarius sp.]|nr:DUF1302 family protein [Roseovarius sp.]
MISLPKLRLKALKDKSGNNAFPMSHMGVYIADWKPISTEESDIMNICAKIALNFMLLAFLYPTVSPAQPFAEWDIGYQGSIETTGRVFIDSGAYPRQSNRDLSVKFQATLYGDGPNDNGFAITPHFRLDKSDSLGTRADLREAYYYKHGTVGELDLELRVGVDQIFWGAAESTNPVNIINQTDLQDDHEGQSKLGQPMVRGTLSGNWGALDLFILPYHRPRIYPGVGGRFRSKLPVARNSEAVLYEHSSGRRHVDFAARYGHSVGPVDFGVSIFDGTSREPDLIPSYKTHPTVVPKSFTCSLISGEEMDTDGDTMDTDGDTMGTGAQPSALVQKYNQIRQVGLDMQLVLDAFIGKAEVIRRTGFLGKGCSSREDRAFVVGGEYSLYGIFGSGADITFFAEWSQDDRRKHSSHIFQNDLFLAARYAFNDVEDTDLTLAFLQDLDYSTTNARLEFNRRVSDSVQLNVTAFKFLEVDPDDTPAMQISEDNHITVTFKYSF